MSTNSCVAIDGLSVIVWTLPKCVNISLPRKRLWEKGSLLHRLSSILTMTSG
jgi:hypothetical protein